MNIHGALNLETFDAPFVEPSTGDRVSATQLLAKIEARNPDKRLIHLIQLPPYCPNLNPIERLWAVMHQCVTHNRHYPTQKQFADAILRFFRETLPKEWKDFRDQVSDSFSVVTHENFRVLG